MAIIFSNFIEEEYFLSQYKGKITDDELISSYKKYFGSDDRVILYKELVDLSEANLFKVTGAGLKELSDYVESFLAKRDIHTQFTAIYSPNDFSAGVGVLYESISYISSENISVFKDRNEALLWLKNKKI